MWLCIKASPLFLSFFGARKQASKQANKQTNKQQDLLLPLGGGVIAMWDLEAPP
jgi:hypothetical protein